MERVTILDHSAFWTDQNGILYAKITTSEGNNRLDYRTALLFADAVAALSNGKPIALLIDLRNAKGTFSNAAAQLLSEKFNAMPQIKCEAYVVNSLSVRLLVQSYKRLFNPFSPFELFNTVAQACEYCHKNIDEFLPECGYPNTLA